MNKFLISVFTVIILFSIHLYWFGIRPSQMIKACHIETEEGKKTLSELSISDERYEALVEKAYRECLRKNGF